MHSLLNRMRLWQKFAMLGLFSTILVAAPLILFVNESNKSIRGAEDKARGIVPMRAVLKVVVLMQQHRGLSAMALAGSDAAQAQRAGKQEELESAFKAADPLVAEAADTTIANRWQDIRMRWAPLPAKVAQKALSGKESFAGHTALIMDLLKTSDMLGDRFGLLLHAQADGYQLVEAALVQSPILMETLGRLRARGAALLTEKNATAEDRALVMSMVDKANDRYDAIAGAIDKATAANPALKDKLAPALQAALAAGKQASELAQEQIVKADQLTFAGSDFFAKATEAISAQLKFYDAAVGELEKSLQERRSELNAAKYLLIGLVLLLLSIISIISYFVSRSVTTPISEAVDVARRVAAGDLTARIDVIHGGEAGELLQALKDMNDGLVNIVAEVRSGTETIATASEQIAAGNVDLSSRTEQQAGSLEETATSVREMAGSVSQNAENARQANQLAHAASDIAVRGGAMVSHVVQTMSTINDSSKRIFDIIGVIDSIAFQTNILALNAAVEAARAGEQGRGFAVVATEVRNLAQRSSAAAKEISQLINDSVEKVNAGTRQAGETGATMDEIVKGIKRVADIVAEIAAANGEQSAGIEQVNEAMQQMDQVTQQNAALVEEAAAAAESLQEQAHALAHVVSVFRLQDSQLAVMQNRRATLPQAGSDSTVPLLASGKAQATRLALPR